MAKFKKVLAGVLAAAMVVTAAPFANLGTVQAATKATKGTSTLKLSATKATIKVGNKKSIKVTVNKKQKAALKVTLKSSNAKVAKVASKATIKKGKKAVKFNIVAKKAGTAKITVSYKTSANKTVKKTIKVTVKANKVALTGVALNKTAPKVGDELSAVLTPAGATDVASYQWFTGATASLTDAISGATAATYKVTDAELGKFIGVVVTTSAGKTFTAVSSVAVQKADASEVAITEAKQTGMAKVQVTFNAAITADDVITVKKGSTEKTFTKTFTDESYRNATLTMADNLSSGTYTVTLTPADKNVKPSSVTFEGVSATKATKIGFPHKVLVMSDTSFEKGYTFVKGYNDFDEEITLSGLTINVAPSDKTSYDASTGKITVEAKDHMYAITKTVSAFVQYTGADGTPLTANETLEVSTIGYPTFVEFNEKLQKDDKNGAAEKLTIAELGTGKYYVLFDKIEDQYNNPMTIDDLNDLEGDNLLSVIPSKNSASMFFSVSQTVFSEVTVGGKKQVAIFLGAGNGMPGTLDLTITSAGGTFKTPIQVWDNSYIDSMDFNIPDIYEGAESDEFSFTAKDQYEKDVNLYDFVPVAGYFDTTTGTQKEENVLYFTDRNHLGNQQTRIQASDSTGKWRVEKDTAKKTFHAYFTPGTVKAKGVITFTMITAGAKTSTKNVTVGEKGTAGQIVGSSSSIQLTGAGTYSFGSKLQFKDANGKTMERFDENSSYPYFLNEETVKTHVQGKDEKLTHFFWTLSADKLPTDTDGKTLAASSYSLDNDGTVDATVALTATQSKDFLFVGAGLPTASFYVTLLGGTSQSATDLVVLDTEAFRFNYVPTSTENIKWTVNDTSKDILYSGGYGHGSVSITLTAKNAAGETWEVPAANLVAEAPFETEGNTIYSAYTGDPENTDGEIEVKVYAPEYGTASGAVDTVKIKYSNKKPVGTSTVFNGTTGAGGNRIADKTNDSFTYGVGKTWFTTSATKGEASVSDGTLTMTNANGYNDTFTAYINDQYGVPMTDTEIKVNGNYLTDTTIAAGKQMNFVLSNGKAKVDFTAVAGTSGYDLKKATSYEESSKTVNSPAKLAAAMADSSVDTVVVAYGTTGTPATLPTSITKDIVISEGYAAELANNTTLDAGGLFVYGTLKVGHDITSNDDEAVVLKDDSELDITAAANIDYLFVPGTGVVIDTKANGLTVKKNFTVSGHAYVAGTAGVTVGANTYTGVVNITGSSVDLGDGSKIVLHEDAVVSSFNMGTSAGSVVINNLAQLKTILAGSTTVGKIELGQVINGQTGSDTITVNSTKGVVLDLANKDGIDGTIVNNGKFEVTSTGGTQTVAKLVNNGTFAATSALTISNLENNKEATIGDGTNAVTVSALKTANASKTVIKATSTVAKTSTKGGTIEILKNGAYDGETNSDSHAVEIAADPAKTTSEEITTATVDAYKADMDELVKADVSVSELKVDKSALASEDALKEAVLNGVKGLEKIAPLVAKGATVTLVETTVTKEGNELAAGDKLAYSVKIVYEGKTVIVAAADYVIVVNNQ